MPPSNRESDSVPPNETVDTDAPVVAFADATARNSPVGDAVNVLRGFCMGAADTVPGVSGGTVALILGHYQRLVTAISHIDTTLFSLVIQKRFREASDHVDLRFLAFLGIGIGGGFACLAGLMHWLLDHRRPETFAVFFGLVVASVWIVRSYMDGWTRQRALACLGGIAVAIVISNLPITHGHADLPYLFLAGSVAICAMILPGISGAFVLLLFGVYHQITGLVKNAVKGDISVGAITQIVVFATGCLFGLLAFTRLLRWLLEHYHNATMAALMGLMIGSVAKLWPLQSPTAETADLEPKFRVMRYVSPADWDGSLWLLATLAITAGVAVIVVEKLAADPESDVKPEPARP